MKKLAMLACLLAGATQLFAQQDTTKIPNCLSVVTLKHITFGTLTTQLEIHAQALYIVTTEQMK